MSFEVHYRTDRSVTDCFSWKQSMRACCLLGRLQTVTALTVFCALDPWWTTPQLAFAVAFPLNGMYNAACRRLLLCRFYVPWWTMLPQLAFAVALLLKGMYKYNDDACLGACRQLMPYWFPSLLVQAPCLRSFFSKTTNSLRLEKVGDWRENLDVAIVKLGLICRCLNVLSLNVYLNILALYMP
jgi:hypothetical protein